MSIFFPYNPDVVLSYLTSIFSIDFTSFTSFETLLITILCNIYFYLYWFFIIYFSLKIINRVYERLF